MYCNLEDQAELADQQQLEEEQQALAKAASKKAKKANQKAKKQQQQSVIQPTAEKVTAPCQKADNALPDSPAQQSHTTVSVLQPAPPQTPDKLSPLLNHPRQHEVAKSQQAGHTLPSSSAATAQPGNDYDAGNGTLTQPALQDRCQETASLTPLPLTAELQPSQHATASAAVHSAAPHIKALATLAQSAGRLTGMQSPPTKLNSSDPLPGFPAPAAASSAATLPASGNPVPMQLFCCPITKVSTLQRLEGVQDPSVWLIP